MIAALAFLTPLPVGRGRVPDGRALRWFPLVGILIGLVLGGVWEGADRLWSPFVAAALVVVADLAFTGMLHLDGLVDSADGLLSHLDRDRRLTVMAQPDVGAFGFGAGAGLLLLRVACLTAIAPSPFLLAALWCASRSVMAVGALALPYARAGSSGGLASAFLAGAPPTWALALVGVTWSGGLALVFGVAPGLAAVAAAGLAGAGVLLLGRRSIGGFTGDVLGAAGFVAETVGLLVASASW